MTPLFTSLVYCSCQREVALGAGIGLVSVSPGSSNNPSVTTFTVLAVAWFIAVQLFASGLYTPLQMLEAGLTRGSMRRIVCLLTVSVCLTLGSVGG